MEPVPSVGSQSDTIDLLSREFRSRHGKLRGIYRAPGRVNLIGEHTDYNDGFVMPAALGFYTYVAAAPREDRRLHVDSIEFGESREFNAADLQGKPTGDWSDYVRGVAAVMGSRNLPIRGANLLVKGEVPIGAGLSSSAAIEVATALALLAVSGANLDGREIASVCQQAEHEYAGTKCGIMDQFISCFGQADHALLLDCRSLNSEPLRIDPEVRLVVCNTMVKHELAGGEYNRRRADCEAGVRFLQQFLPEIRALRDVSLRHLEQYGGGMAKVTFRRCHHVVTENARTLEAAEALKQSDLPRFGKLMAESHASLRDDYEVSCKELDLMVQLAGSYPGVFGARMTGGGFGGCTINLVEARTADEFRAHIMNAYQLATGLRPEVYICRAADGAAEVLKAG